MGPWPVKAAGRDGRGHLGRLVLVLAIIVTLALSLLPLIKSASAAAQTEFSGANSAIQTAFVATHSAEAGGGNVSALVGQLDTAIGLVQKAETENATEPALATADLANATSIARAVAAAAPAVGQQGASARQDQQIVSLGSAAGIIVIAALLYVFGDRIYRRAWLRLYGGYVVRKIG